MVSRSFGPAIAVFILSGCASYSAPLADRSADVVKPTVSTRMTPGSVEGGIPTGTRYTVLSGDTLYGIAFRFELDPEGLAAANRVAPFATLQVGQTLTLAEAPPPKRPVATTAPKAQPTATPSAPAKPAVAAATGALSWQWPVDGKLLGGFSSKERFSRSIRIAGDVGEPVKAAAAGRVVYAGDGLVGLGNLVLIRHNDTWLSAYGHNDSLNVQVNQSVSAGQTIARLGSTGTDRPKLHFEIRRDGEPVDPTTVLPSR